MPTQRVEAQSSELLQGVADALLKSRKVVVVTGAGISTNSGIPDFRSENGLYSLIQAQFDAAAQQARGGEISTDDSEDDGPDDVSTTKRRKTSRECSPEISDPSLQLKEEMEKQSDTIVAEMLKQEPKDDTPTGSPRQTSPAAELPTHSSFVTPRSKNTTLTTAHIHTSPLSSPPPEHLVIPPSAFRAFRQRCSLSDLAVPLSSSPLSSPPPTLFDPFTPNSPSECGSDRRSTSPSDLDETTRPENIFSSSQTSNSARNTLPNMKGKDLFDASIWADPLRTSVFYQFATSLRQKSKEATPTGSHRFISHLRDRGKLVRCYTQNIDQIEEKVGLSTSLTDGPGSKGRFSRRSTANASQLSKMVEEVSGENAEQPSLPSDDCNGDHDALSREASSSSQDPQSQDADSSNNPAGNSEPVAAADDTKSEKPPKPKPKPSGVECVFLHGSLEQLRCFLCGRVCSWDDKETETLSGRQPECPHCVGATVAREERGKRALGVGKLRPDIVLYGEEHPDSHLISPIVTHDLSLFPDMLLILGTSLRVHGLKVMVREFAKAVHSKGGNVVYVNFTKPPESIWGDIIDYWVQWDCDAWVLDLQTRIPKLWQEPEPPKPKKKRATGEGTDDAKKKTKAVRPPPANPVALRDTKVTGAYWTSKVVNELHRISGTPPPQESNPIVSSRRASSSSASNADGLRETSETALKKETKLKTKRPRKSAPGALEKPKLPSSTLNPNHGRSKKQAVVGSVIGSEELMICKSLNADSSILSSVKVNPRVRKRKVIDGEEVIAPRVGRKRASTIPVIKTEDSSLKLAPMASPPMPPASPMHGRPEPLEPHSPPSGPLSEVASNIRTVRGPVRTALINNDRAEAFRYNDALIQLLDKKPQWRPMPWSASYVPATKTSADENGAAFGLAMLSANRSDIIKLPEQTSH